MSAESPRQVSKKENSGHVVLPQTINDPSLIDSVAGFIQEVVPQAYSGSTGDSREQITWVRVQQADINDPAHYPDTGDQDGVPPLLLVLGYGTGVQVWSVPASGEAREVLSWSQGSVRTLCVLPNPEPRLPLRQDLYKHKRPLVAIVDNAGPGPQFCSVNFISLREGDQVKSIKFSQQVWDVVANKRSVVITLAERIAVFDASTLEDNLAITTCYPSPDVNPVALGSRWLAYADRRLVTQWRSLGGCLSEGPHSVTATVFHAAKFLGKGLRDLGETVASSLTGSSPDNSYAQAHAQAHTAEPNLKGIVTILDIETKLPKESSEDEHQSGTNRFVAHFNAHFEPIVALSFDPSGMLLVSADKRGHRFHVFRINPHPCGPTLAYVQHLYTLHRGDTSARVQDIAFSADSRWVAVSSMRGTTHVFPITPYGGPVGMRTHTTPHVVNKLSRFHRSAGLTDDGRNSPVLWDGGGGSTPPPSPAHPQPTTVTPLAQVRRQTLAPLTEESVLRVAACFGAPRAVPVGHSPHLPSRTRRSVDSLYVMASNGSLIQYDLEPRHLSGVTKEKVCDDTGVELHVEVKAEWVLQRPPYSSSLHPPLSCTNPLLCQPEPPSPSAYDSQSDDERWLSQVEIVTHVGPHRRLWMGPQFTFITVNSNNDGGEALDVSKQVVRSNPVNMPLKQPLIIESGSCSSLELSPNMVELVYKTDCSWSCRLREDLAEAMQEAPSPCTQGDKGVSRREPVIERQVNPLGSVVTLTAQLNFPAELLTPTDQVTVVGTEVKKIALESRLNKPALKNILSGCLFGDNMLDSSLRSQSVKTRDFETSDFVQKKDKNRSEVEEHEGKNQVKVLMEVNENIFNSSEERQASGEVLEKKGKNSKSKRKLSKGEKNRLKVDIVAKQVEEEPFVSESKPDLVELLESEVDGRLQCSGDIEMQLREASAEKDLEDVLIEEDSKGRKRSLDITTDMKNSLMEDCKSVQIEKYDSKETKENDKASSRQRKKSKTNDKDCQQTQTFVSDKADSKNLDKFNSSISTNSPEKVMKVEEKTKGKKRRSKKGVSLNESVCLEVQCLEPDYEEKKLLECENQIETQMSQELPAPDVSPPSNTGSFDEPIAFEQIISVEVEPTNVLLNDIVSDEALNINTEEPIFADEKSLNTDDELKGFESDILVKDSSWSPEVSCEKEVDVIMDDKESDKEADKTKNDETTDKDSSDDCQPVVVKTDVKHPHKKGKNRKISRKSREPELKVQDEEMKLVENIEKNDSSTLEEKSLDLERETEIVQEGGEKKDVKNESEDEEFMDAEKVPKESKVANEAVVDLQFIDGVKRRFRKKASLDEDFGDRDQVIEPIVPKRSWSSVVAINFEDPNGNILKPEEPILPVRSWSTIAAGGVKSKSDGESVKTNSVEDRDSVYESCNDSVGEEVEPTCDSLGSCYFETENKETEEADVTDLKQERVSSESKTVSTSEEKSNTDSGEKDDISAGAQTVTKKSKKQKKKKR